MKQIGEMNHSSLLFPTVSASLSLFLVREFRKHFIKQTTNNFLVTRKYDNNNTKYTENGEFEKVKKLSKFKAKFKRFSIKNEIYFTFTSILQL